MDGAFEKVGGGSMSSVTSEDLDGGKRGRVGAAKMREKLSVMAYLSAWIMSSVVSLFYANQLLKNNRQIGEDVFTVWQLACSVLYGLIFTKVCRMHELTELTRDQVRAIIPLSLAYLIKELLKYASLGRVSVNLFNTIRSLGPFFSIVLEITFMKHYPTSGMVGALAPIIGGVAATSLDEMNVAVDSSQLFVYGVGLIAAITSTAINNAQNIYSKILFGQKKIDPISLQIYLSAMSFLMIMPYKATSSLTFGGVDSLMATLFPSRQLCVQLAICGFINFLASQMAFSTLHKISPVSYSVSNTFKRVVITVGAVLVFNERLSFLNGAGIATSIFGVFLYERAVRSYKQARLYEQHHEPRTTV